MYQKLTVEQVAQRIGISSQSVRDRARRRGVKPEMTVEHGHVVWLLTPEQAQQIEEPMT